MPPKKQATTYTFKAVGLTEHDVTVIETARYLVRKSGVGRVDNATLLLSLVKIFLESVEEDGQ